MARVNYQVHVPKDLKDMIREIAPDRVLLLHTEEPELCQHFILDLGVETVLPVEGEPAPIQGGPHSSASRSVNTDEELCRGSCLSFKCTVRDVWTAIHFALSQERLLADPTVEDNSEASLGRWTLQRVFWSPCL